MVQFQSGITLLYCFWATPPEYRTANYDSPDVSDALRACSNILAILADRWPKGECLRDVFELLAREVPLMDRPSRPPTRVSDSSADAIRKMLTKVRCLIVHRSIMRMIEEMISDDFPRLHNRPSPMAAAATAAAGPPSRPSQAGTPSGGLQFVNTPMGTTMFGLPFTTPLYGADGGSAPGADTAPGPGAEAQAGQNAAGAGAPLTAEELIAFPGMFDLDGWT